jgi:hypothetical protein
MRVKGKVAPEGSWKECRRKFGIFLVGWIKNNFKDNKFQAKIKIDRYILKIYFFVFLNFFKSKNNFNYFFHRTSIKSFPIRNWNLMSEKFLAINIVNKRRINHISFEISLYIASNFPLQIINNKKSTSYVCIRNKLCLLNLSPDKQLILPHFNHVERVIELDNTL